MALALVIRAFSLPAVGNSVAVMGKILFISITYRDMPKVGRPSIGRLITAYCGARNDNEPR